MVAFDMPESYTSRCMDVVLDTLLRELPAISIEGAKGVGKTATASQRCASRFDLDDMTIIELLRADPRRLLSATKPVLIDEWQRFASSWDLVRRAVDSNPKPSQFLLTGSASTETGTHSGAGRIVTIHMRPMTLFERGLGRPSVSLGALLKHKRKHIDGTTDFGLSEYADEIVRGGFPGLRSLSERARKAQLDGYISRIVDREFAELGRVVRNPVALRSWLVAYAAATGTTASYETIRDAATSGQSDKPAKTTTSPYRDTLQKLWIVDPVYAWSPSRNRIATLTQSPKHHLVDPALAARLLGVDSHALLRIGSKRSTAPRDGVLLGALFESLVTLSVRVYAQANDANTFHFRTQGGKQEVDLLVVRDDGKVLAIEIKLSATVDNSDVKHLHWLKDKLGGSLLDALVVTTGKHAYRRQDGIAVIPAVLLGP